jgi:hypothetical protein
MSKRNQDKDIMVAESNTILWLIGAVFSVMLLVSVIYEDHRPEPGCVTFEQALKAGVMSYPDPEATGQSCG